MTLGDWLVLSQPLMVWKDYSEQLDHLGWSHAGQDRHSGQLVVLWQWRSGAQHSPQTETLYQGYSTDW